MDEMDKIVRERRVSAAPGMVYRYLTDSDRWARWQGTEAHHDPRPGGLFSMRMANGTTARGQFVELVEDRRVVFTWGWIDHPGVPPGSSTVRIELIPDGDATLVRLTHDGLPNEEIPLHTAGWEHYLPRLAAVAEGSDPGPDVMPG
jgi:uncharacterized protein YndB with AHSA1/START domain